MRPIGRIALVTMLAVMTACKSNSHPEAEQRQVSAANALTKVYTNSALAQWKVRGTAAGKDCGVLFVATSIIMEDALVDALHYGAGAYDIYPGGVNTFSREAKFRGVAYRDATQKVWTYGAVTPEEAAQLTPCR